MHILSPETDNCPSWISWRERMTVENISWSISTKECCRPRGGGGGGGVEPAISWSSVGRRRIQLSHRGRPCTEYMDSYCSHPSPLNDHVYSCLRICVPVTLLKSFMFKFFISSYLDNRLSGSIHIWIINTLGRLSFHNRDPTFHAPGGARGQNQEHL